MGPRTLATSTLGFPDALLGKGRELGPERFLEIQASMVETAEYLLKEQPFLAQSPNDISRFGPKAFQCPASTKPYLVRAVYTNGGTGKYIPQIIGSDLLVSHMSLGRSTGPHRSALVVCLEAQPREVYVHVGGAM